MASGSWACEPGRRAVCPQPQRAAASGQPCVQPAGLAERQTCGRAHRPPHRGSGCGALPPEIRRPAGRRPGLAGPRLGRGREPGRPPRPLLPERMRRDLHPRVSDARSAGAGLPLLLLPRTAPCGQCAPYLGRQCRLSRHLPGSDACPDRGKAPGQGTGLPAQSAR